MKRITFLIFAKKDEAMDTFAPIPVNDCYHVYSDGTRVTVLCDADEDFVYVMNRIAIVAFYCHLSVLGLEVMRTHFHIILKGKYDDVVKFVQEMKRLCSRHFNQKGFPERANRWLEIEMDAIRDMEELRSKIIYVFRNCTEAGYEYLPEDYPWGPGPVYCRKRNEGNRKLSSLGYREICRLFRTRVDLPDDWEYDDNGMLVPGSYMDLNFLREKVFVSPRQYIAFLNVRKKDLVEMELADARPFLERKEEGLLQKEIESASLKQYGQPVHKLSQSNRIALATQFWNERKTNSIKQLSRLTRNNVDVLRTVLHVPSRP